MKKLLLVDGSNLLFQMFYGMPARIVSKTGKPIHGVLGFIGALRKMINEIKPSHICILFDGEHENPRVTLYKEYKSNRMDYSSMPLEDTPFSQLSDIYKALDYMKLPYKELENYEADDYIASYAKVYQNQADIVIASWDSDYFSLINEHVKIYRYRGKKSYFCDAEYLKEKLNITSNQYVFYKALVGDSADNIQGIPKVGPITASRIVNMFSSIEELFNQIEHCPYQKVLEGKKETLLLNQSLISFQMITSLPYSIEELQYKLDSVSTSFILKKINVI